MAAAYIYTYLALGDSYTVGEQVPLYDSYPYQVVQMLRRAGHSFHAPEILARTGWTTDELASAISHTHFESRYDFVTLLIGVNNQYRGYSISNYKKEFEALLWKAIAFAGQQSSHVAVISIPDWSITPFAKDRDTDRIAQEIGSFNQAARDIAESHQVHFIDITPGTREARNDATLLSPDGLHPSGLEYEKWSKKIYAFISSLL